MRCQYAFKTAAGMALAGQVVETFVMQRSVLEYAGYALLIRKTPSLESVFLGRHANPKAMKTQRDAFTIGPVKVAVRRCDTTLADHFVDDYERSINFGGHPNPHAALSAIVPDEREGLSSLKVLAISSEPRIVEHALKCTAQVGLTALCVLQHIFKEKFELLGIRQEIDALKASGMLSYRGHSPLNGPSLRRCRPAIPTEPSRASTQMALRALQCPPSRSPNP